jgi:response regulator RpfG family c-di-GMP phosphodiesterase
MNMKYKMLIVDDEPANLRMLERLFREDYDVITAESGAEALELLTHIDVALIISDQRMPRMTGIEFLKKAALMRQQTLRIILTGYTDVADLVDAVNSGVVYKYITKPWVNTDLQQTVLRAIEYYKTTKKQSSLLQENERLNDRLKTTVQGFMYTVKEMISQKSSNLGEHCRRTSEHAGLIGGRFNLAPGEIENLIFASLLHELPNIRIPFEMDFNRASLTTSQLRVTRDNYKNGLRLISNVPDLEEVASIISYQHECFDGTGFFDGFDGEKIPLMSRILAVANAFDEITSGRNPALFCTDEEAADWLRKRAGTKFDPQVVEVCLKMEPTAAIGFPNGQRTNVGPQTIATASL